MSVSGYQESNARKAKEALLAARQAMTARQIRDVCGFYNTAHAAAVLGGLVRKGIAKSIPTILGVPRMWIIASANSTMDGQL